MNVLWITNTLFPDVCIELKLAVPVIGGWMYSAAQSLLQNNKQVKLAVASVYGGDSFKQLDLNGITYFLLPDNGDNRKYNANLELHWKSVQQTFLPDIVHIHGTEYPHGLSYLRSCGKKNVVVSIQGLISVYQRYYYGGIENSEIKKYITLRDRIRRDSLFSQREEMQQRAAWEREYILSLDHFVGRTSWDKAHIWALNPTANYHFCNETLRDGFYTSRWDNKNHEEHSIFLSQAYYPIKGLHQMVKALPIILKHYPKAKLYIAGSDFLNRKWWRLSGFGNYIGSLIKKNGLAGKIIFTGTLSEKQMVERFVRSHVFVCPSSIENSPNSIGEAQLLGVPCIGSFVGGMPNMLHDRETGLLYRFEEIEMLAYSVCELFSNEGLAKKLSEKGREVAQHRHNKEKNANALNSIYETICKDTLR